MEEYLTALFKEMDYVAETMAGRTLDTVYFGGGTPTSLSAEHLEMVMRKLKTTFDFSSEVKEFTVEAGRPDSITEDKLKVLLDYGVTRISYQSSDHEAGDSGFNRPPPHGGSG